jgi:predicted MFS family arabinose efflux permease
MHRIEPWADVSDDPHGTASPTDELPIIGLLAAAMAAAIFPIIAIGVLSSFIIEDLGISRTQLGLSITVASAMSALAAMALGRFTDRQGGRAALITVFALSGLAMLGIAIAPSYAIMLGAAAVAGLAMGSANPATNRLVVETVPRTRWGTVTGIKQAGEALPIVLGGLILPAAAIAISWRFAFGAVALVPAAAIALTSVAIPAGRAPRPKEQPSTPAPTLDRNIMWLTVYSFVVGLAAASVATYLPLYAQEALGMTAATAGLVVAAMGVIAVVGRVAWGHAARDAADLRGRLRWIALLAIVAISLMWVSSHIAEGLIWIGALVWGASILSVGALGNLAVMHYSLAGNTGRASGVMITGFGVGLMIGAPVFGLSVDLTGAYDVGFALLLVELVTLAIVSTAWRREPIPDAALDVEGLAPSRGPR